jgi:hypothetical protein
MAADTLERMREGLYDISSLAAIDIELIPIYSFRLRRKKLTLRHDCAGVNNTEPTHLQQRVSILCGY